MPECGGRTLATEVPESAVKGGLRPPLESPRVKTDSPRVKGGCAPFEIPAFGQGCKRSRFQQMPLAAERNSS
jgi:hypothetical protein